MGVQLPFHSPDGSEWNIDLDMLRLQSHARTSATRTCFASTSSARSTILMLTLNAHSTASSRPPTGRSSRAMPTRKRVWGHDKNRREKHELIFNSASVSTSVLS